MSRRRWPVILGSTGLAGILAILITSCSSTPSPWGDAKGPKVVVSFAPLYCFAVNVAGPDASVKALLTNQGPHGTNFRQSDAGLVAAADLFFLNGLGLDNPQADLIMKGARSSHLKRIDLSSKLDPKLLKKPQHEHEGHSHGEQDPHVWLGIDLAVPMVNAIRDELKAVDPSHAAEYDHRAAAYVAKLMKLKADGLEMLKDKKERKFVTFHESLEYFANTFQLEITDVIQKRPGREPSKDELVKLIKACQEQKVRVIAAEPQYTTQKSTDRIKTELERAGIADVAIIPLDPLETADEAELNADWYETKMRANLKALADTLK